jgi:aromatic-L-amino-acid decarboxylase
MRSDPHFSDNRSALGLDSTARQALGLHATMLLEDHFATVAGTRVAPAMAVEEIRARLADFDLEVGTPAHGLLDEVTELLFHGVVHTTHPRYFGLFNPTPSWLGVIGEYISAGLNPQLAVWSHAPVANEIERLLIEFVGERLGLHRARVSGSFTTGGAEANLTAVLVALTRMFPDVGETGLGALGKQPVFYASEQSHLAWLKIAHACGLGRSAARLVPTDDQLRLDVEVLERMIRDDREAGKLPFLAVGTAGTTGAGVIDPLPELAEICHKHDLVFHADAAWGGGVCLSDRLRPVLDGIEMADSVTIDAHKWLSVPMGAGMFLTTDPENLGRAFRIATTFMPGATEDARDPYTTSMQWSRRFIGLKLFLTLGTIGRSGYAVQVERDCELGDHLRSLLKSRDWDVINATPLPIVCFTDGRAGVVGGAAGYHREVAAAVVERGNVWISTVDLGEVTALRACITSYRTGLEDLEALVEELDQVRWSIEAAREQDARV